VLRDSLAEVDHQRERLARLDVAVSEQAAVLPEAMKQVVAALGCLYGVAELTAVAEIGDLGRFTKEAQLFSYAGVVPREHSSGGPDKSRGAASPRPATRICDGCWSSRRGTIATRRPEKASTGRASPARQSR
jgi:transposase